MRRMNKFVIDAKDRKIIGMIIKKYNMDPMEAIRRYIKSDTYRCVENADNEAAYMAWYGVFDLWENEQITGDYRNSKYV